MKQLFIDFFFSLSFFLILLFPFKWQNKEESLISTQKNMSIWETQSNKTPIELFALKPNSCALFRVNSVSGSASPNFVGRTKSAFLLCTHLHSCVCVCGYVCVCESVCLYTCQPVLVISLPDPLKHMGYLVGLNAKQEVFRASRQPVG